MGERDREIEKENEKRERKGEGYKGERLRKRERGI